MEKINNEQKGSSKYLLYGIVLVGVALVFAAFWINSNKAETTTPVDVGNKESSGSGYTLEELIAKVDDGVYEANRTYPWHDGEETIDIRVGIAGGIVDSISVVGVGDVHPVSQNFITGVDEALPGLVVGKRIDEIDLPKQVSGSSLTTAAVEEYLNSLY